MDDYPVFSIPIRFSGIHFSNEVLIVCCIVITIFISVENLGAVQSMHTTALRNVGIQNGFIVIDEFFELDIQRRINLLGIVLGIGKLSFDSLDTM